MFTMITMFYTTISFICVTATAFSELPGVRMSLKGAKFNDGCQ
jgi:hypothetical protein